MSGRIRFAVAGGGWRALFFVRAAKRLPELFELTGVLCHSLEKADAFALEHGVRAVASLDALLEGRPDFVVTCVSKAGMAELVMELLERGMPVLSETPLATDLETLLRVFETQRRTGTPLDLAEQYALYPMHTARRAAIDRGLLGEVVSCWLSLAHDYHGISLLRHYLYPDERRVELRARRMESPILVTGGRGGLMTDGGTGQESRTFAELTYADGKRGLYDFSGTQYHSAIRSSHIRVLGTRGEIFDDVVRYADADNRPQEARFDVRRDRITGTVRAISLLGEDVYRCPFPADVTLDEDETAVALTLLRMGRETLCGGSPYPYLYRDAYLSCLLTGQAVREGLAVMETMPWDYAAGKHGQ